MKNSEQSKVKVIQLEVTTERLRDHERKFFSLSTDINLTNGNSDYLVSDFVCVTRSSPSLRFRRGNFHVHVCAVFVRHINERTKGFFVNEISAE